MGEASTTDDGARKPLTTRRLKTLDKRFIPEGLEYPFVGKLKREGKCQLSSSEPRGCLDFHLLRGVASSNSSKSWSEYRPAIWLSATVCRAHAITMPLPKDERFTVHIYGTLSWKWAPKQQWNSPFSTGKWRRQDNFVVETLLRGDTHWAPSMWEARCELASFRYGEARFVITPESITVEQEACDCCGRTGEPQVIRPLGYEVASRMRGHWLTLEATKQLDKHFKSQWPEKFPSPMTHEFFEWHVTRRQEVLDELTQDQFEAKKRWLNREQERQRYRTDLLLKALNSRPE